MDDEQLRAIANRLADDLQTAGPQFSLEISPTPPEERRFRQIAAESGKIPSELLEAMGEPDEQSITLFIDGCATLWLTFWSGTDPLEQLENLVDQAQDVVMETLHEMWPMCPIHDGHLLLPRATADAVEWQCGATKQSIARFGGLKGALS